MHDVDSFIEEFIRLKASGVDPTSTMFKFEADASEKNTYYDPASFKQSLIVMCMDTSGYLEILSKMPTFDNTNLFFFKENGIQNPIRIIKSISK